MVLPTHREGVGRFKDWVGRALHGRCIHACACGAHHVELLACTAEGLKEKAYEAGGAPGDGRQLACVCTHMHACMHACRSLLNTHVVLSAPGPGQTLPS